MPNADRRPRPPPKRRQRPPTVRPQQRGRRWNPGAVKRSEEVEGERLGTADVGRVPVSEAAAREIIESLLGWGPEPRRGGLPTVVEGEHCSRALCMGAEMPRARSDQRGGTHRSTSVAMARVPAVLTAGVAPSHPVMWWTRQLIWPSRASIWAAVYGPRVAELPGLDAATTSITTPVVSATSNSHDPSAAWLAVAQIQ